MNRAEPKKGEWVDVAPAAESAQLGYAPAGRTAAAPNNPEARRPSGPRGYGAKRKRAKGDTWKTSLSETVPAELNPEAEALRSGLARAGKQINVLTQDAKRFESAALTHAREISALRSTITRLKDDKRQLERRVGELVRDSEALRVTDQRKTGQISSLVRSTNRLNNELFWSVCHFIAGSKRLRSLRRERRLRLDPPVHHVVDGGNSRGADLSPEIQDPRGGDCRYLRPVLLFDRISGCRTSMASIRYCITLRKDIERRRRPTLLFDPAYYADQSAPARQAILSSIIWAKALQRV